MQVVRAVAKRTQSPQAFSSGNNKGGGGGGGAHHRSSSPTVLHVFPAVKRDAVVQQMSSRANSPRSGGGSRAQSPAMRSGSAMNRAMMNTGGNKPSGLRSGSPLLPATKKLIKDPHKSVISPFRDINHQPTSTSIDGRLLYMLKDYSSTVMPAQDQKVQNIASRLRRSKILSQPELTALETCHHRNANFMATIERILGEAVEKQHDMRRSVIHQSYEIWRECNDLNTYITTLLDTAQSAIGVGKYSRTNLQNYPGAGSRGASPAAGGPGARGRSPSASTQQRRAPTPTAFAQIAKPDAPPRQQLEPMQALSHNSRVVHSNSPLRSAPHVAESISREQHDFSRGTTVMMMPQQHSAPFLPASQVPLGSGGRPSSSPIGARRSASSRPQPVGVEDAREAQAMFEKLFGPEEGRTRFLHWLSELPQGTIQQLHRSLSQPHPM